MFGIDRIARMIFSKKVVILLYHNPSPERFEEHMAYISRFYNFIPLNNLIKAIKLNDWSEISDNSIVITFDDGYIENFYLLEIFKKFKIFPTIYLCTGIVGTNKKFWFDVPESIQMIEELKTLGNKEKLNYMKNKYGYENEKDFNTPSALTLDQMENMKSSVDFQGHTKYHPIATKLSFDELGEEIGNSRKDLINHGIVIDHFAYPNGDYSDEIISYLKLCGYLSARTTDVGFCDKNTNLYKLKCIGVSDNASIPKLKLQLSSIYGKLLYLYLYGNIKGEKRTK